MNKINFIIPDFLNVDECTYLLSTFKSHKEIFKDNINILGFTGMFPGCNWNKRNKKFDMYKLNENILKGIKNKYNSLNTSLIIVFDKEELDYKDLEDEYANTIMKIFNDKRNYVVCFSKKLKEYIKENYKEVKIIDFYNGEDEKDSEYLIIDPSLNKDESLFKYSYKNKFIIYPDMNVIRNKEWNYKHSKKESKLNKINPKKDKYYSSIDNVSFYELKNDNNYLTYEDMTKYSEKGINTYMLSGYGVYNIAMIENIVDNIYKNEYKVDARIELFGRFYLLREVENNEIHNYRL